MLAAAVINAIDPCGVSSQCVQNTNRELTSVRETEHDILGACGWRLDYCILCCACCSTCSNNELSTSIVIVVVVVTIAIIIMVEVLKRLPLRTYKMFLLLSSAQSQVSKATWIKQYGTLIHEVCHLHALLDPTVSPTHKLCAGSRAGASSPDRVDR